MTFHIPDGFAELPHRGPFTISNGPFYKSTTAPGVFGFLPEERHSNSLGFLHGGMVATFLDSAMAQTIADTHGYVLVTLGLSVTYEHLIAQGRWAEARVTLGSLEGDTVSASVNLISRNISCASAEGRFKLLLNRPLPTS